MQKISNAVISEIARRSLRNAGGSPYVAYERAKKELGALLVGASPTAHDSASRRLADALRI